MAIYNYTEKYDKFINIDIDSIFSLSTIMLTSKYYYDRFNLLNNNTTYNFKNLNSVPKFKCENNNIEEICDIVVEKYINYCNKNNKIIAILWSGGVDSTCTLVSFLKNKNLNLNKFIVLYTQLSINENQYFFDNYIKNKIKSKKFNNVEFDSFINSLINNDNYLFVSSQCGDQLFGSTFCKSKNSVKYYFMPWEEALREIYNNHDYSNFIPKYKYKEIIFYKHLAIYKRFIKDLNLNIRYFYQFSWLLDFSFKWNYVRYENPILIGNNYLVDNYKPFFEDMLFQEWGINNIINNIHKNNMYFDKQYYKLQLKDIIYKYDNNRDYYINKGKTITDIFRITNKNFKNVINIYDNNGINHYKLNDDDNNEENTYNSVIKLLAKYKK